MLVVQVIQIYPAKPANDTAKLSRKQDMLSIYLSRNM